MTTDTAPSSPTAPPISSASWLRVRLRKWVRPPRRLKFTRMGRWYTAFTLFIGFAAINTGNNLLFLLLGLMLAGIVLSGVISESTLRGLTVERVLPLEARAGKPALVGLRLTNAKSRTASFAVVARDVTATGPAGRGVVLRLGPNETREIAYRWEPARRGKVVFTMVELATRYPFGLFEKWREFDLVAEAVVFPREVAATATVHRRAAPPGERPSGTAGTGTEYFGLRDVRPGDDARHIHWRTSARRGRPVVIEREKERRRRVAVVIDNRVAAARDEAALDRAVESAAALVRHAALEQCEIAFAASEVTIPPGAGPAHERRILRALALLGPASSMLGPARVASSEELFVSIGYAPAGKEEDAA